MSCLDEIGSQVVHIQWNEPPRHSKAGSTPPEKRDEKIRKTFFFLGGWSGTTEKMGYQCCYF